jgi:hypothetical protein
MKLQDTGQDTLDLDFEIPDAGVSVLQFQEGVQKRTNENTGKTTLQIPFAIDQVVEGPEDNEGRKLSHFVPIETDFGEKQLAGILTLTGLMGPFAENFGDQVDITSERFINALKLKLPGKFIKGYHEVRKDQNGRDRANIIKFERVGTGGSKATKHAKPADPASETTTADESW